MKYLKPILFALFVVLLNCKNDESTCPAEIDLGEVSLLQSSRDIFPYDTNDEFVVFKDVYGNEFKFQISKNEIRTPNVNFNSWCKEDENVLPLYNVIQEYHTVEMFDESMDKGFKVRLLTFFNYKCPEEKQIADLLELSVYDTEFMPQDTLAIWKGNLEVVFNERNYMDQINTITDYYPVIELNGVPYAEVFVREFVGPIDERKLYFNIESGLIGFTEMDGQFTYNFDRIE